jgi:hypothetical protein
MDKIHQVTPDITILPSHFPIFGVGVLSINAFVITGKEPVLVDTGMGIDSDCNKGWSIRKFGTAPEIG